MNLVLPQNHCELDFEVIAGDGQRFYRNLTGLLAISPVLSRALKAYGINTAQLAGAVGTAYGVAYAKFGVAATISAGVVGGALAVGSFALLWNVRMFY